MTSSCTVAARYLRGLVELCVTRGASRSALYTRAAIDPAIFDDADARVPVSTYIETIRAGKELCGDPALALHFGEALDLSQISILGMVQATPTFADGGLAQMNRLGRLDFDCGDSERFRVDLAGGRLHLIDMRPEANETPEITESTFARMVCTARRMLGDKPFLKAVYVTHAAPTYRAEYDRIFQVPVDFDSDRNALVMSGEIWQMPVPPRPEYVSRVMTAHAEVQIAKLDNAQSVRRRVEELLLPTLDHGDLRVDAIASKLGFSRQTLFRKLRAEGVTFEKVLDDVRRRVAMEYLSGRDASVAEAAYRVGFSDATSFSRAFKRWTGKSPRAQLRRSG